jgi:nitrogen fixation/metabolism regulation signal transduction histidine kinase
LAKRPEENLISGMKNLKHKVMIDPLLQKKVISNFMILGVSMIAVNLISFYVLISRVLRHIEKMNQVSPELYSLVMDTWSNIAIVSSVLSLVILFIFAVYGLFFSNRIAGPIYNLRNSIERILNGESPREIKLRKDDYFHDLSAQINRLIAHYSKKNP